MKLPKRITRRKLKFDHAQNDIESACCVTGSDINNYAISILDNLIENPMTSMVVQESCEMCLKDDDYLTITAMLAIQFLIARSRELEKNVEKIKAEIDSLLH